MIVTFRRLAWRPFVQAAIAGLAAGVLAFDPPLQIDTPSVTIHVAVNGDADVASLLDFERGVAPVFTRADAPPVLARWWRVEVPADRVDAALAELAARPEVAEAFVPLRYSLPDDGPSCPIRTPKYDPRQGYLGPAPEGIDVAAASGLPGGRGEGVWFADIEGGWNERHEDLPGDRIEVVAGRPTRDEHWEGHGTAVLGEVVGRDNGLGVVGIAPDVERVFVASVFGAELPDAIDRAAAAMRPGDVLLIELQSLGPRGRWIPVELSDDVFDAIAVATARGVIVVEAAGNGNEDLDHPIYEGAFDRRVRDSGAIVVGAGAPPRPGYDDRARLDFSNHGSRVDVQGWGRGVTTLDYGDLQTCRSPARERDYTDTFSGTSSASPIVAGAAVILEGVHRARFGVPIPPHELRWLMAVTGSPQTTGEHIGPRPDLSAALRAMR